MDAILHDERLAGGRKRTVARAVASLPDGAMIALGGRAFALRGDSDAAVEFRRLRRAPAAAARAKPKSSTPPSIVAALAAGYHPRWAPAPA